RTAEHFREDIGVDISAGKNDSHTAVAYSIFFLQQRRQSHSACSFGEVVRVVKKSTHSCGNFIVGNGDKAADLRKHDLQGAGVRRTACYSVGEQSCDGTGDGLACGK